MSALVVRDVANVQIKLSMREELLQKLEEALEMFPASRTTNLIACDVIEKYLPLWIEVKKVEAKKVKRQHTKHLWHLRSARTGQPAQARKRGAKKAHKGRTK